MNWIEPDWPVANNIHAASTLRMGGMSQGYFASLNPADHVNDEAKNVAANRKIITEMLGLPTQPVWMQQVHGQRVIKINQQTGYERADASFTQQTNTVCAILTADCLPILVASREGKTVAAIHAGWRGLLNGIITNTIAALGQQELLVWLGPAIGADCFEVGGDIKEQFVVKSREYNVAFKQTSQDKYLADIYQLAIIELIALGITDIYGGGLCTVTDKQRFYSYRRDGETGRMATLIWRD